MLVACERQSSPTEIKEALEGNDAEAKAEAMKKAIMLLLSGEQMPQLFITIVRYVLPSEDHTVQKLLLLYLVGGVSVVLPRTVQCANWPGPHAWDYYAAPGLGLRPVPCKASPAYTTRADAKRRASSLSTPPQVNTGP